MQWTFLRYVFASLIVQDIIVTVLTAGPSWNTPSSTALSKTSSECGDITSLDASSTDGSSIVYSLVSQDPNGNFVVGDNPSPPFDKLLQCTQASITASSFSVIVRAAHDGGNNEHTDLTLTISFTDVVGVLTAGPSWNTPSSTTLSKTSSECGTSITSLDASSTDGSSVVYSLVSQDPNGNFVVGDNPSAPLGKLLQCTQASITASSYTVVVRATHDGGNNEHTDLTLTITFTDLGAGEAPVFVDPDPNSSSIDVPETIQAGDTILTLSATDVDTDDATLTFNMDASPSATKELFEITGNLLKVKAGVATDYFDVDEKEASVTQFIINLEISDGTLSTNLSTTINVKDVNDNSPEFFGNCTAIIPESAMAGYSVLIVSVTDNDKTKENNQISLTLSGASEFEIIGEEILVATGADFDAIKKPYFRLTITASDDAPTDPKSTVKDITIIITSGQGLGGTSSGNSNRGWQGAVVVALCVSVSVLTSAGFSSSKGGKLL